MPEIYFQKMTANGYHEIEEQIEKLKHDRPAKIKQLKEARALGDLSENAEYSAAKRDLRHLESRLRFLNKQLTYAQIIKPTDNETVQIGSTVTIIFDGDENDYETYIIVGKQEANVDKQKISFESPIGAALMGHSINETVTVSAPAGQYEVTIKKIEI